MKRLRGWPVILSVCLGGAGVASADAVVVTRAVTTSTVEVLDAVPEDTTPAGGFVYRCRWSVAGSVGHWGHVHRRINQYDAVFTVEPVDGQWRIAAIDLREEKRVDPGGRPAAQGA
jgi:hypothetical protein